MAVSFFALLDDVASLLDDVSMMVKVATKKTAGVLGDDLALNANQLTDISAKRELPVIWQVSKGSLLNKAIIVPVALLLSVFLPGAVPILLMLGGAYLCFEGVEKVIHFLLHRHHPRSSTPKAQHVPAVEMAALEKEKIQAAVRTDFILSAEVVVIALGSFVGQSLPVQILGLSVVAIVLTIAVYGVVAVIVKIDDVGLYWCMHYQGLLQHVGKGLLWLAPKLLKLLAYVGTAAMFIVGGHLWVENIALLHHFAVELSAGKSAFVAWWTETGMAVGIGTVLGLLLYGAVSAVRYLFSYKNALKTHNDK